MDIGLHWGRDARRENTSQEAFKACCIYILSCKFVDQNISPTSLILLSEDL